MYGSLYRGVLLPLFDGVVKRRGTVGYWRAFEKSQWLGRDVLEARQLTDVRTLLAHANSHCPYYRDLWRDRGIVVGDIRSRADFQQLPLMTRNDLSTHRLRMRDETATRLIAKGTGGSSGEPVQFDLNPDSNDRRTALMFRGYGWGGAPPGSRQLYIWGTATGNVPAWKRMKTTLHRSFDNQMVLSCFEFTPEMMLRQVHRMNLFRAESIVAYTNPLYEMARFLEAEGLTPWSPSSIIVGAEKLHPFQRELIERVFQAPVFETYGSREFMLIGAECDRHEGLHLSCENLLVEILDDNGRPTPDGQEGNVVVTDLFNYGMPFIRYVNGDRAVAGFKTCSCGRGLPLLTKVTGRQLDVLQTLDGRKIPGEFFPHLLKDYTPVRRFQVVQRDLSEIVMKIVARGEFTEAQQEILLRDIRQTVGTATTVRLELVDDIPLTKAGKLKVVVNDLPH